MANLVPLSLQTLKRSSFVGELDDGVSLADEHLLTSDFLELAIQSQDSAARADLGVPLATDMILGARSAYDGSVVWKRQYTCRLIVPLEPPVVSGMT